MDTRYGKKYYRGQEFSVSHTRIKRPNVAYDDPNHVCKHAAGCPPPNLRTRLADKEVSAELRAKLPVLWAWSSAGP